jgi:transposase
LVRHEVKLVAIERPDGLLVERLLEAGLRILPLHPNQVTATRDRFRVSGGKSDRFDAFVLCELARTDHHRFRVLEPDSDQTKALRALTRAREDLVGTRTALSNQLRAELARFWPGPLGCSRTCTAGSRSRSLSATPAPADTRGLGAARLQGFLARERYTGRQKPAQLLAKLRRAPAARVGELELRTRRQLVLSLVTTIKTINGQIKQLERQIATAMREHPDGAIFLSLFKKPSSVICAAELLAEIEATAASATHPRHARRRRRPGRRRGRVRQTQSRQLPLGLQQAAAPGVRHAGGQHPPPQPLGPRPLRQRPRPRARAPPRDPHPRARLVPDRMALLARPGAVRTGAPPRPATAHHRHHPDRIGARTRPRRHGAHARRRPRRRRELPTARGDRHTVTPLHSALASKKTAPTTS